jgi:hypothetical protein
VEFAYSQMHDIDPAGYREDIADTAMIYMIGK